MREAGSRIGTSLSRSLGSWILWYNYVDCGHTSFANMALQVLVSIMKWCWSRLPGGVVTWETYDLFKQGETGQQCASLA